MIRQNKGFTLVEVLIGVIFLAVGLLAVAGIQTASIRGNFSSNNLMLATYAAQDGLEELKSKPLTDPDWQPGVTVNHGTRTFADGSFQSIVFTRSHTVVRTVNPSGNAFFTVNYQVTWNDGVNRSLSVSTVRSQ
jgi:type IV pilus modification protein PilV